MASFVTGFIDNGLSLSLVLDGVRVPATKGETKTGGNDPAIKQDISTEDAVGGLAIFA